MMKLEYNEKQANALYGNYDRIIGVCDVKIECMNLKHFIKAFSPIDCLKMIFLQIARYNLKYLLYNT